jgi:hypothetical protein
LILLVSGCFGRKEDAMPSPSKVNFTMVTTMQALPGSPEDPDLVPPTDFGVGPQGYWIRSRAGLKRLGFAGEPSLGASTDAGWNTIDWSKHELVLVTLGVQGTTGHTLRVDVVEKAEGTLTIAITHFEPKGAVGEALTHPAGMIRIERQSTGAKTQLKINGKPVACDWHVLN